LDGVLRLMDPSDPVRYDYGLFGLGVEGFWTLLKLGRWYVGSRFLGNGCVLILVLFLALSRRGVYYRWINERQLSYYIHTISLPEKFKYGKPRVLLGIFDTQINWFPVFSKPPRVTRRLEKMIIFELAE
jgi:hypothetical protein